MEELVELIFDLIAPIVDAFLESLPLDWPGRTIQFTTLNLSDRTTSLIDPLQTDPVIHFSGIF